MTRFIDCLVFLPAVVGCSAADGDSFEETPESMELAITSKCGAQSISFYDYYAGNPGGSWLFYANQAVYPTTDLGNYGNPALAVNGVRGTNGFSGSLDVYSTRNHGSEASGQLILKWSANFVCNGPGADFVVFENGFFMNGQNGEVFIEPAVVSVSQDGTNYETFPFNYLGKDTNGDGVPDSETASPGSGHYGHWQGFAGLYPVFYHETTHNYFAHGVDPFFPGVRATNYAGNINGAAGGDLFDLAALPNTTVGLAIKQYGFRYIKLTRATKVTNPDTGTLFPIVPSSYDQGGSDIDGVYAKYMAPL